MISLRILSAPPRGTLAVIRANIQTHFEQWVVSGQTPLISYPHGVMVSLGEEARRSVDRDIGGVLFGNIVEGGIRIVAARPIRSEYAFGPDFHLSETDEREMIRLVDAHFRDGALRDLLPVGWYRSRRDIRPLLGPHDVQLFDRYFWLPFQVVLIIQPQSGQPTIGGFFFRPRAGPMVTKSSVLEFEIPDQLTGRSSIPSIPDPSPPPTAEPEPEPTRLPPLPIPYHPKGVRIGPRHVRILVPALVVAAALASAAGFYVGRQNNPPYPAVAALADHPGLQFRPTNSNELRVMWDTSSAAIRSATSASLQVVDGAAQYEIPIPELVLRAGGCTISYGSGRVAVTLQLHTPAGRISQAGHYARPDR